MRCSCLRRPLPLGFFGALWISELVSKNKCGVGELMLSDIQVAADSVQLHIRSKTDKLGKGVAMTLFTVLSVLVVQCYVQVREGVLGPFLRHVDGSSLLRFQFVAIFKRCLVRADRIDSQFNTHSFQVGAAMEAACWGLSQQVVRRIGRVLKIMSAHICCNVVRCSVLVFGVMFFFWLFFFCFSYHRFSSWPCVDFGRLLRVLGGD